jgi:CheY-like chemotaxis protein
MVANNPTTSRKPVQVLLIDDQQDVRSAMAKFLTLSGFQVTEAASGEEALAAIRTPDCFDAVLTDLHLNDMDGLELAQTVRSLLPETWIALVTGWSFETADLSQYGIDQLYYKPISLPDLCKTRKARQTNSPCA